MKTQFDLTNIEAYRDLDNYKVIDNDEVSNNNCLVCFSSNGLYFPNTDENLQQVIDSDKYEWQKIIQKGFSIIIYIRDIYKQWYVEGISNTINSVEKVNQLLLDLTEGYESTFIGSSAGGYAAVLFCELCQSDKIINFSGQFDIALTSSCEKKNAIVHRAINTKHFDVSRCIANVYYFFPVNSEIDKPQYELIKNNINIKTIKINSHIHGIPVFPFSLNRIVNLTDKKLLKLTKKTNNKMVLSLVFMNVIDFFYYVKIKVSSSLRKKFVKLV